MGKEIHDPTDIKTRYSLIKQRMSAAIQTAKRTDNVRLIAVSKYHAMEKILSLHKLGQIDFAESYVQEAEDKIIALGSNAITWHFIGPIQSNKTRLIANLFDWVHSIDRLKIARRISQQRSEEKPAINICLQININNEEQKSGFKLLEIENVIEQIIQFKHIKLRGLMAIPIKTDDIKQQRESFSLLRKLMLQLNQDFSLDMDTLSMGMSNDLEAAIFEGANMVRVGTALFGNRL
jgi:PLP dependent protein